MRSFWFVAVLGTAASGAAAQSNSPALFVVNNVGNSVTSFTPNPDGTLTRVGVFPSASNPQALSLSPDGRWLAVVHGTASITTEELRVFRVNPDASLTLAASTLVDDSPLDVQWTSKDVIAVTRTTSGSGGNFVRTLGFDGTSFTPLGSASSGSFNSRLSLHPTLPVLYANDSLGNAIRAFDVGGTGTLTNIDTESVSFAVDTAVSPDGRFLYGFGGISGDDRQVFGFSLDSNGALDPLATPVFSSNGTAPKNGVFSPDGSILFVGHGSSATLNPMIVNPPTGALTATTYSFDVGIQGDLGELAVIGDLVFATDTSSSSGNPAGVISFRYAADGALTFIGKYDTGGARPQMMAAWVPEPATLMIATLPAMLALRRYRPRRTA